ncbi:hypothetical protein [Paenibacillus kribbensis]|uniref:hypothetical protein n=1 Tax=Paenibacillus kribbensis TaxID=172713 RepID=UPI0008388C8A|nr:hypothetical protein [Paenibacillus kribbensis]
MSEQKIHKGECEGEVLVVELESAEPNTVFERPRRIVLTLVIGAFLSSSLCCGGNGKGSNAKSKIMLSFFML